MASKCVSRVPNINNCLACSKYTETRYKHYIVDNEGKLSSSYDCVTKFYGTSILCPENYGCYLCRECKRLILKALKYKEKHEDMVETITKCSQELTTQFSAKRLVETDCLKSKRFRSNSQQSQLTIAADTTHIKESTTTANSTAHDLYTPPYKKNNNRKVRKEMVVYRTVNTKQNLANIVHHLTVGNVKLCIKALLQHKNQDIKGKAIEGVNAAIKEECLHYTKKDNTHIRTNINNIENFSLAEVTNEIKTESPLLWAILSSASTHRGITNDIKITAAAAILYNTRQINMNAFQRTIGLTLYNNQLQKEGFLILSKLGFTTSYSSVNRDLHKLKEFVHKAVIHLKHGVEENNNKQVFQSASDHSYSKEIPVTSHDDHAYNKKPLTCETASDLNPGYRFNIDNLDFHLKVRNMTEDHQNSSKHYVQVMAIQDRVLCEHLGDKDQIRALMDVPVSDFVPNAEDIVSLREDFITIVADIIIKNVKSFKAFSGAVDTTFRHDYTENMKQKSKVIPLGILPLNENKTQDMIEVLTYLHKYVPGSRNEQEILQEELRDETSAGMRVIPLGGDQLTCERVRCAHLARLDGDTPEERLEGVITMIEDFHEKMNFLQMIMDKYYLTTSAREQGTLYQLKNLINRRNVVSTVSQDYHANSEFVDLVTECHVIAASLEYLNMENLDSECDLITGDIKNGDLLNKKKFILQVSAEIVDNFFLNTLTSSLNRFDCNDPQFDNDEQDKVLNNAANFTKLGLLRKISILSTRFGDGLRLLRHWKYSMILYNLEHKTKYRLEAFLLLAGINALFTPRQRHQIIFNRFINLTGGEGNNLDGDYVMELLNKYAKARVKLLGPNHSSEVVDRIGKTMMTCHNVQENLERQIKIPPISRHHTAQNLEKDRQKILQQLIDAKVFKRCFGRLHPTFDKENNDLFSNLDIKEFHLYIRQKQQHYSNKKFAF